MKLNCIIVDDEPLALDILEDYIRRTPSLELAGRFTGGAEALAAMGVGAGTGAGSGVGAGSGAKPVDLALLDIQMPGMDGIEVAKRLGGDTRVIFTTAFPQYALEGFRVDALDYLLKPVSFTEFTRAVDRAVEWFAIKRAAHGSGGSDTTAARQGDLATRQRDSATRQGSPAPRTLIVKSDYKQFVIPIDTIVYIEGIRDYIRIHLGDGSSVQTLMNLKTVEGMLPSDRFARVHRSYIVALDRVKRIERAHIVFDEAALAGSASGSVSVPISDTYKEAFLKLLADRSVGGSR